MDYIRFCTLIMGIVGVLLLFAWDVPTIGHTLVHLGMLLAFGGGMFYLINSVIDSEPKKKR